MIDGTTKPTDERKFAFLMSRIGHEGIDVYELFELDDDPSFKDVSNRCVLMVRSKMYLPTQYLNFFSF